MVAGSIVPRCRLLDTMRAYGLEKLAESGEREWLARRHAEHYRDLFERAEAEREARPTVARPAQYAVEIDNLRAALDWAFSSDGDPPIGVALTAAAVPVWMQLSLVEECRRVQQALAALATVAEPDARQEMKLLAALGASQLYTRGGVPEVASAWTKALELAEKLGDLEYQKRSLWGLWSFHVNGVDYRTALSLARRFASLVATSLDPNDRLVGERMIGVSYHNLGDRQSARRHIERAITKSAALGHQRHFIRLQLDPQVTARVHLARILWLEGFPDRAMREAEHSVADARAAEHAISFSYALHRAACPVALWNGDLAAAGHYADMLLDHAKRHALVHWQLYGWGYQGAGAISRGDVATGLRLLRSCFKELGETGITAPRFMRFAATYMAEKPGRSLTHLTPSTTRSPAPSVPKNSGKLPSCCASKASWSSYRMRPHRQPLPKIISSEHSTGRFGKAPCHGNCAPLRASPGCGAIRAAPQRRWRSFSRFTTASPKGSTPPI